MRLFLLQVRAGVWHGLVGLLAVLAAATVHAQTLRLTAGNASNSAVYDLTFSSTTINGVPLLNQTLTPVNTDANLYVGIRSMVYVANLQTGKIDLLIADASKGIIARYADINRYASASPPPPEASTVVWSTACGTGPAYPDGLSVDDRGNVFVVSSGNGSSKVAGLWVLPGAASQATGTPSCNVAPWLVDGGTTGTFAGTPEQLLEETLFAFSVTGAGDVSNTAASTSDLLLAASSPTPAVFRYSGTGLQTFLTCIQQHPTPNPNPACTLPSGTASILIGPSPALTNFSTGVVPSGMDLWPRDNSLLIVTGGGTILRYNFPNGVPTPMSNFAGGLGNGKYKLKTGWLNGVPLAFVANNNGGDILEFGEPLSSSGSATLYATVTNGVQHPQGLAASNLNATDASVCQQTGGCDVLGGSIVKHTINGAGNLTGNYVLESVCVVEVDPRLLQNPNPGSCTGKTLPVSQVCAGFGTTVIPDYLCGASGTTGGGFALVKATNTVDSSLNGALVANEASVVNVLGSPANPVCDDGPYAATPPGWAPLTLGWAPLESEGSIVEDNNTSLPLYQYPYRPMLDMTNFCHSSGSYTKGLSLFSIGLVLNPAAFTAVNPGVNPMVTFATMKYAALNADVNGANVKTSIKTKLLNCISASQKAFNATPPDYSTAASDLLTCDTLVAKNVNSFYPIANLDPNPSGEIRGRIGNLYLTIWNRILGNPAPTHWPP